MKRMSVGWLGVIVVLLVVAGGSRVAHAQLSHEQELKAMALYNFLLFVEWPIDTFGTATAPVRMCVLGNEPFTKTVEMMVRGKQVNGRSVAVTQLNATASAAMCHLVFVGGPEISRLPEVLRVTTGSTVLTVCDADACIEQGAVIGLFKERNKLRFEISSTAAARTGLKISSFLLNLAKRASSIRSSS